MLGTDPKLRIRLARTLGAAAVFMVCLLLEALAVWMGLASGVQASMLAVLIVVGQCGIYLAIRTGRTKGFKDPALTLMQMVFAIVVLTLAYAINPSARGLMPMIMALVLVFGAFILPPARCWQLGWLSVLSLGIGIGLCTWQAPHIFEPRIELFHFLLPALVLPAIAKLAAQLSALRIKLRHQKDALGLALGKVHELATRDELTGLPNRRHFYELWDYELQRRHDGHTTLCICLLDIDHFKHINDRYGHQVGDEALRLFANILSTCLRAGDVLARWGGEEFMLLLPDTTPDEALKILERMRLACNTPVNWSSNPTIQATFSAGVTAQIPGEERDETIARADAALYAAKHQGRNQALLR